MNTTSQTLGKISAGTLLALLTLAGAGCQSTPKPSGFLSSYQHLTKLNDSTWRYVDSARLGACERFHLGAVEVLVTQYQGAALTPEERQKAAERFRQMLVKGLSGHCQLVDQPGPGIAEIRAAITAAYPVGPSFALGLESEIMDGSGQQVAALREFQAGSAQPTGGPPSLDAELNRWFWDRVSATTTMEEFAGQLRMLIENARKH
jgi:hypothetical protein